MDISILKRFGFAPNDIKVYTILSSIGRSKTGPIIAATKIASSRVYESLRKLVDKGLVSYEVKNNIKYYKTELPDQLIEEAEQNTAALRELAKEIELIPITKQDRNETNTYEGLHGFRQAFIHHVSGIEKNEEVSIIAFSNHTVTKGRFTALRGLFREVDDVVFSKTKNVRMVLDKRLFPILKKDRNHFAKYILKFLPPGYFSPVAVNISEREVMISVWGQRPVVFTMRNPVIVESFKKNFEFLWGLAKKA